MINFVGVGSDCSKDTPQPHQGHCGSQMLEVPKSHVLVILSCFYKISFVKEIVSFLLDMWNACDQGTNRVPACVV